MSCPQKALEYFEHYNCSQAVIAGCRELTGLDESLSLAIAGGFGGGMRHGGVCGAVTGALMVLGLIFPSTDPADAAARGKIGRLSLELQRRFMQQFGCLECSRLIGDDKAAARATVCRHAVEVAAGIAEQLAHTDT